MGRHRRKSLLYRLVLWDLLAIYTSFFLGLFLYKKFIGRFPQINFPTIPLLFFAGPYFIFIFKSVGLYKKKMGILNILETVAIFKGIFIGFGIAIFFLLPISVGRDIQLIVLFTTFFMLILIPQERLLIRKWIQNLHKSGIDIHNTLIIGTGGIAHKLAMRLQKMPKLGFKVVGFIQGSTSDSTVDDLGIPVLGRMSDIKKIIEQQEIDSVFVAYANLSYEQLLYLMNLCDKKNISFKFVPYIYSFPLDYITIDNIEGMPIVGLKKYNPKSFYPKVKTLFDFIVSAIAIILLFPLGVGIALLVKFNSPGGIFFSQTRVGHNGKLFKILKFRTMYITTNKYEYSTWDSCDKRITPVGRFLRKTSLDELPQLINVLRGEMSLVGPRPEMPFIVEKYSELHKERLKVKPGITGLWQVGEHRNEPIHQNIEYDLFYIENQSFLLDLAILLRTFISIFSKKGV